MSDDWEVEGTLSCQAPDCDWESDEYDQMKDAATHFEVTGHPKFALDSDASLVIA